MIYLAAPYTHPSLDTRNWRYQRAKAALFELWENGEPALCPIVQGHEYENHQRGGARALPHEFWMLIARAQLVACTKIYVLTLQGWEESKGLEAEITLAHGLAKPIIGFAPNNHAQDVSGLVIMRAFGLTPHRRRQV